MYDIICKSGRAAEASNCNCFGDRAFKRRDRKSCINELSLGRATFVVSVSVSVAYYSALKLDSTGVKVLSMDFTRLDPIQEVGYRGAPKHCMIIILSNASKPPPTTNPSVLII